MTSTYDLIGQMKQKINTNLSENGGYEAYRAYEIKSLPIPLDKMYITFSLEKLTAAYVCIDDEDIKKVDTRICVNFFVPLNMKGQNAQRIAEDVMYYLSVNFHDNLTGYTIGDTVYDSSVKAYKVKSAIEFSYLDE